MAFDPTSLYSYQVGVSSLAKKPRTSSAVSQTEQFVNAVDALPVFDVSQLSKQDATPFVLSTPLSQIKHAGVLREDGGVLEWIKSMGRSF